MESERDDVEHVAVVEDGVDSDGEFLEGCPARLPVEASCD